MYFRVWMVSTNVGLWTIKLNDLTISIVILCKHLYLRISSEKGVFVRWHSQNKKSISTIIEVEGDHLAYSVENGIYKFFPSTT